MSNCERCSGRGHICIDDICRSSDECFHGDSACPVCFGDPDYDGPLYNDGQFYDAEDEADDVQQQELDESR